MTGNEQDDRPARTTRKSTRRKPVTKQSVSAELSKSDTKTATPRRRPAPKKSAAKTATAKKTTAPKKTASTKSAPSNTEAAPRRRRPATPTTVAYAVRKELQKADLIEAALAASAYTLAKHLDKAETASGAAAAARELRMTLMAAQSVVRPKMLHSPAEGEDPDTGEKAGNVTWLADLRGEGRGS